MLWSDPHEEQGWKPSDRGAGILWGPDLTKSFLSKNNLELVIRSHEMVDEGTKPFHNDHCITLFSASNYTGTNENQGAVITFSDPANVKNFDVHRYFADAIFEDLKQSTSVKATSEARKSETLQKLRERIFQERHALSLEFFTLDKEQSGKVSVAQFIDALHKVLALPLNWTVLWPYFAKASDGRINYTKFLDRYKMAVEADYWDAWANSVVSKLCQSMFAHGFSTVKEAFSSLDKDGSGAISYGEFVDALKSFDLGLSEMQMYDLIRSMDSNEDAHIDYDEFLARFESSFSTAAAEEHERDAAKVLLKVSQVVHKHYKTLRDAFSQIDKNDSGRINSKELRSFFKTLPIEDTDTDTLFKILDRDGSGSISYKEFKRALKPRVAKEADESRAFFDGVLQNVCDVLHRSKVQLRAAFRMMDIDGSGKIDVAEFKAGLEALNVLLEVPLSDSQISTLHSVIDKDKDGSISYEEFLASFSVVDKDEQ
jgi:protein phosphatase